MKKRDFFVLSEEKYKTEENSMFRRIILFLTVFLLLFTSCAVAESAPAADPDYVRAFMEGYADSRWQDVDPESVISSTDFRAMLLPLSPPSRRTWCHSSKRR